MFEIIDLFNGYMKITTLVGILDVFLILHFLLSYYFNCYKKGYLIDLWHSNLFFNYFITILIFYPFMGADRLLELRADETWKYTMNNINLAWGINVIGFLSIFLGGELYKKKSNLYLKNLFYSFIRKTYFIIEKVKSRGTLFVKLYFLENIICLGLLIYGILCSDTIVNLRVFFMTAGIFSAFSNLFIQVMQPIFIFISLGIFYFKVYRVNIVFNLLLSTVIIILYGARSTLIIPIISFILCLLIAYRKNFNLYKSIIALGIVICLFFGIEYMRTDKNSHYMNTYNNTIDRILFGNNVSDIRDFSVILEYWDGEYLYGKNIIAGIISFIPKEYSEYRKQYNTSSYTNNIVGLPDFHPGLRGGAFCESFLSFGYIGVILYGLIYGYILKILDILCKDFSKYNISLSLIYIMSTIYINDILYFFVFQNSLMWLAYFRIIFLLFISYIYKKLKV